MSGNHIYENLKSKVDSLTNENDFTETALEVFYYQFSKNKLYGDFCNYLHRSPQNVKEIRDIPFLPISFFKTQKVVVNEVEPIKIFQSSGTTGMERSKHYIADIELYKSTFKRGFRKFFGAPSDYVILALLPSYLQQKNSSLVFMTHELIRDSHNPVSGFYLDKQENLAERIWEAGKYGKKVLLLGVTYALLDVAEKYPIKTTNNLIVMETGGMKGRRKELLRQELHQILTKGFGVEKIYSEYGMTELLSQAYSQGEGIFYPTDTMRILIRDTNDPLTIEAIGKSGGINVVDLANLNSCSFIATQDLGKIYSDGSFEILGRFDNSDIRGCNLLVQ